MIVRAVGVSSWRELRPLLPATSLVARMTLFPPWISVVLVAEAFPKARAERHAGRGGATELRIGVLANNGVARRLYLDVRFQPHLEIFLKERFRR